MARSLVIFLSMTVLLPSAEAFVLTPVAPPRCFSGRKRTFNSRLAATGFNVDEIESRAVAASEAWDVDTTPFLDASEASAVEERLGGRADCEALRIGGYSGCSRSRFVLTNPELGLDADTASSEYVVVLRVTGADLRNSDPLPNVLVNIGVDLDDVGDIVFDDGVAYLVVTPGKAEKACVRLLPKELVGSGISVDQLDPGEVVPDDGELQVMEVQRLDKREQKRRK